MNAAEVQSGLMELEALPLLGDGLVQALDLCARLAAAVAHSPDCEAERRLVIRGAQVALAAEEPDAVQRLTEATQLAGTGGETIEVLRLRLLTARALAAAQHVEAGRALLASLEPAAIEAPALASDWHLAAAACGTGDTRFHLEMALCLLPSPSADHDRLGALLRLADLHQAGGDRPRTRDLLDLARKVASAHGDDMGTCHVVALLGNLLVESGLPREAEAHLDEAVRLAHELGDTLTVVAEGAVLASLLLQRGEYGRALAVTDLVWNAAGRRNNLLGVADAAITGAACLQADGNLVGALNRLVLGIAACRAAGSPAAEVVLKARLAELRSGLGPEVFDPPFAEAMCDFQR